MVLDWHLEQSNPERLDGIGPLLQDILRDVAARSDVAWLKAADVADWWKQRRRMLSPETEVR
jgi:hypothetical protein